MDHLNIDFFYAWRNNTVAEQWHRYISDSNGEFDD